MGFGNLFPSIAFNINKKMAYIMEFKMVKKHQNHSQHNSRLETPMKKQNCVDKNIQEELRTNVSEGFRIGLREGRKETLEEIREIIDESPFIFVKDVPNKYCGEDLTWIDKAVAKAKKRLLNKITLKAIKNE